MQIPNLSQNDINRFWSKVAITAQEDKCWNWTAGKRRRGYGRFTLTVSTNKDEGFVATRVAYFIEQGVDPSDKCILHSCDNPSCVNPKHLSMGTNKDNTQDMLKKGRHTTPVGSKHGRSKLVESDVYKIRQLHADGISQKDISLLYNVDTSAISNIIRRRNWGWLI